MALYPLGGWAGGGQPPGGVLLRALSLAVAAPTPVAAQDLPWRGNFDLNATNEPLNVFLTRLLTLQGIPTVMSPAVATGRVNGRFKGQAGKVFKEMAETYGLAWFYDGVTLEVCSLAELETRLLEVDAADLPRLERALRQFRLSDARYPLRSSGIDGQLLISGPPRFVELVSSVADRVAMAPTRPKLSTDVRLFRLKHARAADTTVSIGGVDTLVPGVARILNDIVNDMRAEPSPTSRNRARNEPGLRGKGLIAAGNGARANGGDFPEPQFNRNGGTAGAAGATTGSLLSPYGPVPPRAGAGLAPDASPDSSAPRAARDGNDRQAVVRAEPRLNAVIVRDVPERMALYARLIESLDIETPLIEIEATVIDITDGKSEQLGIDWRSHGKRFDVTSSPNGLAGRGNSPTNDASDLLPTNPLVSAGSGFVGTLLFGASRTYFLARLNALTESGDARTSSKPRVLTIDNNEAVLQSTNEFFVRVAGNQQVDLFNVTLGLTMRVTPTLIEDAQGKRIKMIVRIEDGNTNNGGRVDQIPIVSRNAIATQAIVGDGQSLLIGGYTIEESSNDRSGVPGLSNVPILGWLFGQRGNSTRRVERIFMLTPRIVMPGVLPTASLQGAADIALATP
ncbi:MAG: type III secretion system outer membrane ring subunit SctC [Rubrivivax sp.]|nr:type III secretion system outer membrane ring subunit SctC [Rubrivivax sp.]